MSEDESSGAADAESGTPGEITAPVEEENELFRLRVTKDRMHVILDCDTEGLSFDVLAEAILGKLAHFGVIRPPALERLRKWLADTARTTPRISNGVLMSGVPPIPPRDGYIEWGGDFFNPGFEIDEATGRVNFRKHLAQRNVAPDQLLATLVEPLKGKNGIDVLGRILRPRKPRRCRLRAGDNVRSDEGNVNFYALASGRIRFQSDTLSVDQTYEIDGDVGLETGDIAHVGAVVVHGDVLKGCRLEAVGDIEVMGVAEGAQIQTGGMLRVHGGISGAEGTRIIAAGGVHARYLLDVDIQSNGDICVESEIMHAKIMTRGALYVPGGRIIGGSISALGGIDTGQAGSPASVPTILRAGEDHSLEGRVEILQNKLRLTEENIAKIQNTVAPLKGKIASLPEKSREALRTLLEKLPDMEASVITLKDEIDEVRAESQARARSIILIRGRVYPDTRLVLHGETLLVREEVEGPLKPVFVDGRVRLAVTNMRSITQRVDPETGLTLPHAPHGPR